MRLTKLAATLLLAISLPACASAEYGPKQSFGTLLGAAGGAVAGSQIGKGRGQLAATAAGTLLGALIGGEVGKGLDRIDQMYAQRSMNQALNAPIGSRIQWQNPRSGNRGRVIPTREGRRSDGAYCREYQQTIVVGGQTQQGYGTACRTADGQWQMSH